MKKCNPIHIYVDYDESGVCGFHAFLTYNEIKFLGIKLSLFFISTKYSIGELNRFYIFLDEVERSETI